MKVSTSTVLFFVLIANATKGSFGLKRNGPWSGGNENDDTSACWQQPPIHIRQIVAHEQFTAVPTRNGTSILTDFDDDTMDEDAETTFLAVPCTCDITRTAKDEGIEGGEEYFFVCPLEQPVCSVSRAEYSSQNLPRGSSSAKQDGSCVREQVSSFAGIPAAVALGGLILLVALTLGTTTGRIVVLRAVSVIVPSAMDLVVNQRLRQEHRVMLTMANARRGDLRVVAAPSDAEQGEQSSHRILSLRLRTTRFQHQPPVDPSTTTATCSCTICFMALAPGDRIGAISCGHPFHVSCLKEWLRRKNVCPLCCQAMIAAPCYGLGGAPLSDSIIGTTATDSTSD